jgi:hypothetical protein
MTEPDVFPDTTFDDPTAGMPSPDDILPFQTDVTDLIDESSE